MTAASSQSRSRGRLGSRKSTTGCITCKIRKIKCDESQPACRRCMSTGRKCDGYARGESPSTPMPSLATAAVISQPHYLSAYTNRQQSEIQAFEFFICRVMPGLSRIVDENFWHQLLPQASTSDEVIWYAVNAMSQLIKQSDQSLHYQNIDAALSEADRSAALKWYSKSVTELQKQLQSQNSWSTTCSITSIIYMCIECLLDNANAAFTIYNNACQILAGITESGRTGAHMSSVDKSTLSLLEHMGISQGVSSLHLSHTPDLRQSTFASFADVRGVLYCLISEIQSFIRHVHSTKASQAKEWVAPANLATKKIGLEKKLATCHSTIASVLDMQQRPDDKETNSVVFLCYGQYVILLSTSLNMYETAFDIHFPIFEAMIEHARLIIDNTNPEQRPFFSFETRVIPGLFFVATKCRHPRIRRQAVDLLCKGPQIENTRKAASWAAVAQKHIAIEESGCEDGIFLQEPLNDCLPPECHRICWEKHFELRDEFDNAALYLNFGRWRQDTDNQWFLDNRCIKL